MIDPDVRPADSGDAESLSILEREARGAVAESRGGRRWLDEHPAVGDGWIDAVERRGVFVAEVPASDGVRAVVGYIVADLCRLPADAGPEIAAVVVDQVFVHPDARELGFGDELLAAAMAFGRDRGATLLEAETLPGDRDIKNLYERAGITARLITVSKPLVGPTVSDPARRADASR